MHVNPITHDGLSTIGYDADGSPGLWPGIMLESTDYMEWRMQVPGASFIDMGGEIWTLIEREFDDVWCWQGPDGRIWDPKVILEQSGDK